MVDADFISRLLGGSMRVIPGSDLIHGYCTSNNVSDLDREALKILNSELLQNPNLSLDEIFNTSPDSQGKLDRIISSMAEFTRFAIGGDNINKAAKRLYRSPRYRQRIYGIYQKEIGPMLDRAEDMEAGLGLQPLL